MNLDSLRSATDLSPADRAVVDALPACSEIDATVGGSRSGVRIVQPATVHVLRVCITMAHRYFNRQPGVNRQSEISNDLCMRQ
jgi:hypothetical protein